jgi:hypothetical protein
MKDQFREIIRHPFHLILMLLFLAIILAILWLNV